MVLVHVTDVALSLVCLDSEFVDALLAISLPNRGTSLTNKSSNRALSNHVKLTLAVAENFFLKFPKGVSLVRHLVCPSSFSYTKISISYFSSSF